MGIITVITSGKGGAGKSTVAAGLGCAIARFGRKVVLLDGDAGLRSLDVMLGISERAVYDMSDIFDGNCEPIRAVYQSPVCDGVSVVPAPVSLERMCSPVDMRRLCRGFAQYYDHVIVDCPAGIGQGFECAIAGANRALVVTTPDMICARDAYIVGRILEKRGIPSRLIINRLRPTPILSGKMPDVDEIIDTAMLQLIGIIPEDEEVALTSANGRPLPTDSNAAICLDNIARRFLGEYVPLANLEKMV
ncbi:MAG TPA: septum site-determining protein MinD [Candidatus Avimonas sp.]|nr:septum site-determining protein MinD [Candidatus Avimonas sp.]HQA16373.1 septum site-determining protein MinD [Candidatus Avimonas sp.]HQD37454.1 septum site-determining protein MinD [Candidatus Avimonas sp.]